MIDISIDMLSLNNADSVVVWLKDHEKNNFVILIDGGNKGDGEKVITHLNKYILPYTDRKAPDLVICTHHDKDHVGGLMPIVEYYRGLIGEVWVNNPAEHISSFTYQSVKDTFRRKSLQKQYEVILESLTNLDDFISKVDKIGIKRCDALAGRRLHDGIISILGPSDQFYKSLLPGFENIEKFVTEEANYAYNSIFGNAIINESLESSSPCPIVDEENSTSATNNSSVILEIRRNGERYLFTGDAGVMALEDVDNRSALNGIYWLDVPHHGSRRNLSSELISKMSPEICFISAKGGPDNKHPRKALVNCLKRHGALVYSTHKSGSIWHHRGDFPARIEYSSISEL